MTVHTRSLLVIKHEAFERLFIFSDQDLHLLCQLPSDDSLSPLGRKKIIKAHGLNASYYEHTLVWTSKLKRRQKERLLETKYQVRNVKEILAQKK